VSTLVTAELFVRPAVRALAGQRRTLPHRVPVRLAHDVSAPAALTFFLRASLTVAADGVLEASLTGRQGSNLATSMARAQALLEIDGPAERVPAGSLVPALLLDNALLHEHVAPAAGTADADHTANGTRA
jgi:molybdopterin molybdotransferase